MRPVFALSVALVSSASVPALGQTNPAPVAIQAPASGTAAQERRANTKDADLGKKGTSIAPDKSLAGDITRKKDTTQAAPTLKYDQYRLGVEMQVASKRREQIESLKKIISLSNDVKETPSLLFRLGELYWEESKYFFFEANRKDDQLIDAMNRKDKAGQDQAKADKEALLAKSKQYSKLAVDQYSTIVQRYKDFERTDEVLFFLGQNLMESGEDRKALVAYKRLVEKYPKSKYVPDAHLAFGEYYFNNSKGKRDYLEKALESYKKAASFPENQVYAFALYKQGWCYFNLNEFQKSMDMFKSVVLYGEYAGANAVEKDAGAKGKSGLIKEARTDFVRAYSRVGSATDARAEFGKVASKPEDRFLMMKQLANLYYDDGKDREAALTFNSLIKEKPLSPEAPGFQGKIVDCVLRAGNKAMTVSQVRRLVEITSNVEKSGMIKDEKDKRAVADARELSERTVSNLAVNWHNEAKKTRDPETFKFANEVYSDYLTLFPDSPKAYDLRFFWAELLNDNLNQYDKAATEYTRVLMMDVKKIEKKEKPGRFLVNSAYNAVLAYDEVVKKAEEQGLIKTPANTDLTKKLEIPAQKKALLEACERYVKYVPHGDKRVEVAFKAANIYYRYNHFDEAVQRFAQIALSYPEYKFENGDRAAEISANLVLDSYNLLGDWAKVNEWARKFYNNEKLATGKFRDELSRVIEQSSFKLVNQLEAKKEYAKAGDAYLAFVAEFPKSDIADTALFNASIDYFNAKMLDKALEVRRRIVTQYPRSKHVPACIFANAEVHEAVGDFEDAAQAYEWYVAGYERHLSKGTKAAPPSRARARPGKGKPSATPNKPEVVQVWEEQKAQVALFNAAVLREGLGQYKSALKNREKYLELWPDAKDSEGVFLSIADLHIKNGANGRALAQLEAYEKKYQKDPNKVLAAEGRVAELYGDKMHRPREAQKVYKRAFGYYESLPGRAKKALDNPAADTVARAHLAENEEQFKAYERLKLRWGAMPSPEVVFKEGLKEKAKSLEQVQRLYTQTVQFKSGDPAICALYKIGLAYDNFASTLINAPMPRGAPPELQDAIREELGNQSQPVKEKAAEAFAAAVQKSQELDLYNDCYTKSLQQLRDTYRPDRYPPMMEDTADLKGGDQLPATGVGLLAAVQAIPKPVTPSKEAEAGPQAREKNELPSYEDEDEAAPTPAPPSKSKGNSQAEEPEDSLQ